MSRQNRRRAPAAPVTAAVGTPNPALGRASGASISWLHCLVGLVVGEVMLLLSSNIGLRAADAAFGNSGGTDGGIVGMATLLSVMTGGYLAARLAGRAGMYQGIVVGVGFIFVAAAYQFFGEASTVHAALAAGGRNLVDLGPMNMGGLMSGDILALFGGSVGGLLSGRR